MVEVNKVSGLNFMSSDGILSRTNKHKDTICSNCGSNSTSSSWYITYNKDGSWDKKSYHCNACHCYFNCYTGKFSKNPKVYKIHENTVCSGCGSSFTSGSWCKTYNKDGSWDRKSYHCNKCHYYFDYNTGKFSRFLKGPDLSNVQELNFMSSDSIQLKVGEHKSTVCSNCGSSSTSCWYKKRDENGNWDRKLYICTACYHNPAYRSGELNPDSSIYKGIIGVETVARVLGDKDCTIMKQGSSFDICSIQSIEYGKIEVKTITYSPKYGWWMTGKIRPGLFDTLFILCTDSKFRNISRVYIIDGIEVCNRKIIPIYRNPSKGGWYKEFRVDDIIQYQEVFQIVKNENQISKNYVYNSESLLSTKEKGDICEEIVRIAINAETSTDIRYDLIHKEYKRIEVKGSGYRLRHKYWHVSGIEHFKFNTIFIVCMSNNFEKVERIYIIPKEDVGSIEAVAIYKDPSKDGWYKKFRAKDIILYQEACKKVLNSDVD